MQLTESPPAGWKGLTIRSRSYGGRLTVFRMMIISSLDYLTPAGRNTSVTRYPIIFVIEAFFISKAGKIVRSQLAGIQRKMYKIVPAERQECSEETITKNRCKPSKNGLQRSFLAPPAGFEPVACRLGGDRSIQLNYGGLNRNYSLLQGSRIRTIRFLGAFRLNFPVLLYQSTVNFCLFVILYTRD